MQAEMTQIAQMVAQRIPVSLSSDTRFLIAIDGRCASGKTTLAEMLREQLNCTVFHMDDYFLRPEQRTETRHAQPGGNVDYERFAKEILNPLKSGKQKIVYRPFDCHTQKLLPPVAKEVSAVVIVEGSYSCLPIFWSCYDLHVFLTVDSEAQLYRIRMRNAESVPMFLSRWIPLEERYFQATSVQGKCELCFET